MSIQVHKELQIERFKKMTKHIIAKIVKAQSKERGLKVERERSYHFIRAGPPE